MTNYVLNSSHGLYFATFVYPRGVGRLYLYHYLSYDLFYHYITFRSFSAQQDDKVMFYASMTLDCKSWDNRKKSKGDNISIPYQGPHYTV